LFVDAVLLGGDDDGAEDVDVEDVVVVDAMVGFVLESNLMSAAAMVDAMGYGIVYLFFSIA
jgi:hypothetical protein